MQFAGGRPASLTLMDGEAGRPVVQRQSFPEIVPKHARASNRHAAILLALYAMSITDGCRDH